MGCIPWADESMIRVYPQRETAHRQVTPFPTERHDTPNVALTAVYITNRPEGTPLPIVRASDCVSSGGLSLRVAADPKAANVEK